ncbi:hypothetical protein N480_10615 [Pseudoalteromonas luteoviolacea S2607]|nr:hypothetical protein N480_10615 [Pseudoalteromonas luteoviolacea S2607]
MKFDVVFLQHPQVLQVVAVGFGLSIKHGPGSIPDPPRVV